MTILVALSAGVDSTALLSALVQKDLPLSTVPARYTVAAMHVHHGPACTSLTKLQQKKVNTYRKAAAMQAEKLALHFKVPFHIATIRAASSSEASLRAARWRALQNAAQKRGYALIATGHHLQDSAETILWNLIRGTGPAGLTGLAPRTENIIRPLITYKKDALIQYVKSHNLKAVDDPTNAHSGTRVFLRSKVLPRLATANVKAVEHICAAGSRIAGAQALVERSATRLRLQAEKQNGTLLLSSLARAASCVREAFFLQVLRMHGAGPAVSCAHLAQLVKLCENPAGGKCITLRGVCFCTTKLKGARALSFKRSPKKT